MSKRRKAKVEETALSAAWRDALTGPARPSQIASIAAQFPGKEPIQIALEDIYPLVMSPDNYDSETLVEVAGSILGELEHRKYVDQVFENDLMSYYFGESAEDLRDQIKVEAVEKPYRLIGLCGEAGSGKDTAASFLVAAGWTRIAFADPLKAVLYDMHVTVEPRHLDPTDLSALVDEFGWDVVKVEVPEARALLQRLGVATRDHVHSDAWLNAAFAKMQPGGKYVVSDARFPNELAAIKGAGGKLVLIDRPDNGLNLGANAGHISETAWRDGEFDTRITNNGTIEFLGQNILGVTR